MAEVASSSRPPASRGRPAGRASRASHTSRGAARSAARQSKDDSSSAPAAPSLEEQGELGQLKLQYKSQLDTLSELFPDWTDDDLVFALNETDGDLQTTIERISEGNVSQFADVKKKTKDKSRSRKEATATESAPATTRGRGRGGHESGRGGRGRGSERGGRARGGRGGSGSAANGTRSTSAAVSVPTTEVAAWGDSSATGSTDLPAVDSSSGQWGNVVASEVTPATASEGQKSSLIPEGSKKSWASMLAQKPAPAVPKPVAATVPPKPLAPDIGSEPRDLSIPDPSAPDPSALLIDPLAVPGQSDVDAAPSYPSSVDAPASLAPPKDSLTEDNLEALPDESIPAPTDTTASTRDASSVTGNLTPYGSSGQVPTMTRPPLGGYATTAWKATATPGRSASYQRRMMEQREAVVMPGNHAVDRAAIQFGNMGLNNGENKPLDVDEDREETQTRTLPQQSPPSQPRASLPPAPRQPPIPELQPLQEGIPTPKPAPGLPFTSQQPSSMAIPVGPQNPLTSQPNQSFGAYGRLPGNALNQDPASNQKPYDPFSQQLSYSQSQQDTSGLYQTHSQSSNPSQPLGNFAQGSGDSAHQFTAEQQRSAYQSYYASSYNQQQAGSGQQDQNAPPQRSASGLAADSGYGSGQGTTVAGSRISESQTSGHTTPNPTVVAQHQMNPHSQQAQHMHHQQGPGQGAHGGNFAYQNPYYSNSYYNSYMGGYPNSYYNQQGYGAPFGGKSSMYGQPHHGYGMTPQGSYEHSSSPANAGNFGSSGVQGRDSALSGTLTDYARTGSAQQSQPSTTVGGGFSNTLADGFSRGGGGFAPNQQFGQQQQQQQQQQTTEEPLKGFNEPKTGPSPALGQPGRAGSAVNNAAAAYGGNQSNYAPPQQSAFGGYPSHLNQLHSGAQYGGLGGLGGHQGNAQSHQAGGYDGYGSGFSNTYGNYGRGGWGGGNYGGH